jgi:hypothetical protein
MQAWPGIVDFDAVCLFDNFCNTEYRLKTNYKYRTSYSLFYSRKYANYAVEPKGPRDPFLNF